MRTFNYLIALVLLISSCGRFKNQETKQNNEERILCISKQYNEIIYALGANQNIVAVDISSTYPPEIKKIPTVGYHRALSAEAILAVKPTLIIHDNNIGPEHVVKQLNDLEIPMKVFGNYKNSISGTDSLIREIGTYFNKQKQADSLCKKLLHDMEIVQQKKNEFQNPLKVLVIHFGQASNVYLVMTKKSTAAKMIEWAGGEMAIDDEKGMKQISPEVVAASNPDVIFLTDFGYDRLGGSREKIQELPGISNTKAFKNNRIYRIEEHDLVYLGPRTGENILLIHNLLYQNVKGKI